jgi:hypothetical protein
MRLDFAAARQSQKGGGRNHGCKDGSHYPVLREQKPDRTASIRRRRLGLSLTTAGRATHTGLSQKGTIPRELAPGLFACTQIYALNFEPSRTAPSSSHPVA